MVTLTFLYADHRCWYCQDRCWATKPSGTMYCTVTYLKPGCKSLTKLWYHSCARVTDQGFLALLERCAAARAIDICGCTQITEASVTKIFGTCPKLRSLNLGGLNNIDESKFDLEPGSMQTLQALNLCGSSATDHVIDKVICELQVLHLCTSAVSIHHCSHFLPPLSLFSSALPIYLCCSHNVLIGDAIHKLLSDRFCLSKYSVSRFDGLPSLE